MEVMFFYSDEIDVIDENITKWLEHNKDIKILNIKQSSLAPDSIILNPNDLNRDFRIERSADLVVSIWYTRS
jgi:hypothetical protein